MDGRTVYSRIIKILLPHDGEILHIEKIKTLIRMNIASSDKAVVDTLRLMGSMGLIKEGEAFQYTISATTNGI